MHAVVLRSLHHVCVHDGLVGWQWGCLLRSIGMQRAWGLVACGWRLAGKAEKVPSGCLQGLRSSIPPNFPYFAVEIGLSSGHVHVIDDEDSFADDFGRGVLVGLLQLPAELMHKRAKQEGHAVQVGRTPSSP